MEPELIKLTGSIIKYGATRERSGDKVKRLTLEVFGSFDRIEELMESPLKITIEVLPKSERVDP